MLLYKQRRSFDPRKNIILEVLPRLHGLTLVIFMLSFSERTSKNVKNGITHVRAVLACRRAGGQAFGRAEHATRVARAGRAEYLFLLIKPIDMSQRN